MKLKNIFIISGPSGAGEDSIINGLKQKMPINKIITTTTRKKRIGEKDGVDYYFISKREFKSKVNNGEMAEWALEYNNNYYGVTTKELQRVNSLDGVGIWKIEYKGVITAKKRFPGIVAILIMADSLKELERRIKSRETVDEEYITERMKYTRKWLKHKNIYDHKIINKRNQLDQAIDQVANIIYSYSDNAKQNN